MHFFLDTLSPPGVDDSSNVDVLTEKVQKLRLEELAAREEMVKV